MVWHGVYKRKLSIFDVIKKLVIQKPKATNERFFFKI